MGKVNIGKNIAFYEEASAYPGVKRVAEQVKQDIRLVTGQSALQWKSGKGLTQAVIYGTVGNSNILNDLEKRGILNLCEVRGKREVYSFQIVENPVEEMVSAVVIAGSDKRGTIYGLYHLSEIMGVSPLVNWNHVWPEKKENVVLTEEMNMVSREPSVKYRGFFINDEWPAFGTWAQKHFGGINAECYEQIFELLLRLKGNYLWPAMWNSNFNLDGPGLLSAQLADEYGIVMSMSHHEPCMRSGGEYGLFRGKNSKYGDAWDFNANPDGITQFWRDGLLRTREYENVITMGMRGENDTAIMKNGSLEDNIALLRKVLKTQNQLIRETVNKDLTKVPRQIVLFTEVEEFFYGNETVSGLMDDSELEGVTLILSDNNHGFTRTLPSESMRGHNGGYGMYYHMDMHGGAYSFQWIGSTYLPRLWEQMTAAYEYGVQEIWVTNIGDIGTQEFGLSYFLDLAYDIEKWGGQDASVTERYTKEWLQKQFGSVFDRTDINSLCHVFADYTRLLARRKHEVMNDEVYHPIHFGEAQEVLDVSQNILDVCKELKAKCSTEQLASFVSLVYYPACGTANLMKMWILSGRNKLYAQQNRVEANLLADMLLTLFDTDEKLVNEYMTIDDGYFDGFGLSEHIGFTTWCDEDNKYPLRTYVRPANQPRMIVARIDDEHYLTGDCWRDKPQLWRDALRPDVEEIIFEIACASRQPVTYRIRTDCPWISFSSQEGQVALSRRIILKIHRNQFSGKVKGSFFVENVGYTTAEFHIEAYNPEGNETAGVFWETDGYIAMEASHFQYEEGVPEGKFHILAPYGRTGSAIKVFPVTTDFYRREKRPFVEYHFEAAQECEYEIRFYMVPTTPVVYEREQYIGFSINEGDIQIVNTVKEVKEQFFLSRQWSEEAYSNIKILDSVVFCNKGLNRLRFWGMSPGIVLERIVLHRKGTEIPESYLGPKESYFHSGESMSAFRLTNGGEG